MIQDRLNDKEHDIQGVQKQSSELLSIAWRKGYQAGFDDGYATRREAEIIPQGDLISREALKKEISSYEREFAPYWVLNCIDNAPTFCGNNPKWCESCISKGKCASTSPSEKQSRIVRLVGNQGKMTIDLDKKPIG